MLVFSVKQPHGELGPEGWLAGHRLGGRHLRAAPHETVGQSIVREHKEDVEKNGVQAVQQKGTLEHMILREAYLGDIDHLRLP
jgi:hypothetical protein